MKGAQRGTGSGLYWVALGRQLLTQAGRKRGTKINCHHVGAGVSVVIWDGC